MIDNLTKLQYYQLKNIPLVVQTPCLDPMPSLSQHLISPLLEISDEVLRAMNSQQIEKNLSLQLSNANKIIFQLEEQIQLMIQKHGECEDQLSQVQMEKIRLTQKVDRLNRRITDLEGNLKKTQFEWSKKLEDEKLYLVKMVTQNEQKAVNIEELYKNSLQKHQEELKKMDTHYSQIVRQLESRKSQCQRQFHMELQRVSEKLKNTLESYNSIKKKFIQNQEFNREESLFRDRKISELTQKVSDIRSEYEHLVFNLKGDVETLQKNILDLQNVNRVQFEHHSRFQIQEKEERQRLISQLKDTEATWRTRYEALLNEKQKLRLSISQKNQIVVEKQILISQLRSQTQQYQNSYKDIQEQFDRKAQDYRNQIKSLKSNFNQRQQELMNDLKLNIHQRVIQSNEKCKKELTSIYETEKLKYVEHIKGLEVNKNDLIRKIKSVEIQMTKVSAQNEIMKQKCSNLDQENKILRENGKKQAEKQFFQLKFELQQEKQKNNNEYELKSCKLKEIFDLQITEVTGQLQKKVKQCDESSKRYQLIKQKMDDLSNEKQNLTEIVQQLQEKIYLLNQDKKSLIKNIEEKDTFEKNYQSLLYENEQITSQRNLLHKKEAMAKEKNVLLFEQIKQAKESINEKNLEIEELKCQLKKKQSLICAEREEFDFKVQNIEDSLKEKTNEVIYLSKQIQSIQISLKQKNSTTEKHWSTLQNEFQERTRQIKNDFQKRITELKQILEQKNKKYETLQKEYFELQEEYNERKSRYERESTQYETLSLEWQSLIEKFTEQKRKNDEQITLKSQTIEDLEKGLGQSERTARLLNQRVFQLEKTAEEKEQTYEIMVNKRVEDAQNLQKMAIKIEDLEKNFTKKQQDYQRKLEQKNYQLRDMRSELRRNLQKSQIQTKQSCVRSQIRDQEFKKIKEEYFSLEKTYEEVSNKNIYLERQIEDLHQQISELVFKNQMLTEKLQSKEKQHQLRISDLQFTNEKITQQFISKEKQILALKVLMQENKEKNEEFKNKYSELNQKYEKTNDQRLKYRDQFQKLSKNLQIEREKMQVYFSKLIQESDQRVSQAISEIEQKKDREIQEKDHDLQQMEIKIRSLREEVDSWKKNNKKNEQNHFDKQEQLLSVIRKKEKVIIDIEVEYGKLQEECDEINKNYYFLKKKMEFVYDEMSGCKQEFTPYSKKQFKSEMKNEKRAEGGRQVHTLSRHKKNSSSERIEYPNQFQNSYAELEMKRTIQKLVIQGDSSVIKSQNLNEIEEQNSNQSDKQ